jgi:hypothetical protein
MGRGAGRGEVGAGAGRGAAGPARRVSSDKDKSLRIPKMQRHAAVIRKDT